MTGWIKLHRKLADSAVFDNEKILKVFIYCLLSASHKNHDQLVGNQIVHLKPGQFIFGRKAWSERLKIKERTLYDYMRTLESLHILRIDSNNKFSVVTIVNWGFYQLEDGSDQQQTNNKPTTNQQQTNTNKNDKNDKNDKNNSASEDAGVLLEKEFGEWYELYNKKKDRKAALTKYKAARKKHSYEQIMNGTKEYLKTITDKQYQKYPKTFLFNETYLEEHEVKDNTSSFNLDDL